MKRKTNAPIETLTVPQVSEPKKKTAPKKKKTGKSLTVFNLTEQIQLTPGQGTIQEQEEKRLREIQRLTLFEMINSISDSEINGDVIVYHDRQPIGLKEPSLMRFFVKDWVTVHEIYWESLCSRLKLAIGGVIELKYDNDRGVIKVRHFDTPGHNTKPAEYVAKLIGKICLLIERGELSTDSAKWRHKAENSTKLSEITPAQAAGFMTFLKLIKILFTRN